MYKGYSIEDILDRQYYKSMTEDNYYSPIDDRVLESYVEDINGGDNFADYCGYIFNVLEEEGYYD